MLFCDITEWVLGIGFEGQGQMVETEGGWACYNTQ